MRTYKQKKYQKGFTLIEIMVATSIFVIVMLASMSSLFVMLDAAKNSKALRFAMDNVNFALESMTRSIRMGTNYYCGTMGEYVDTSDLSSTKNCSNLDTNGGTLLAFKSQYATDDNKIVYKLSRGSNGNSYIARCESGNSCVSIVSPDVNIEKLKFFVDGANDSDNKQANVYIIIKGTVMVKGVPTSFAIQTLASKRNF